MKKKIWSSVVIFFVLSFTLIGCQKAVVEPTKNDETSMAQNVDSNSLTTIQPADLSKETKRIISALGVDSVHVFELSRNEDVPMKIHLFVEVFEKGVKKDNFLSLASSSGLNQNNSKTSQLIFTYDYKKKEELNETNLQLSASIVDKNGSSGTENEVSLSGESNGYFMSPLNTTRELELNQAVTLITLIEDNGSSISYSEDEILKYDKTGEKLKEFDQYDRVILFRAMVQKDNENL